MAGRGDYGMRGPGRLVTGAPTPPQLAKVSTATITAGGTGEVTILKSDGTATARTLSDVKNHYNVDLPVDTKVLVIPLAGGRIILTVFDLECPA